METSSVPRPIQTPSNVQSAAPAVSLCQHSSGQEEEKGRGTLVESRMASVRREKGWPCTIEVLVCRCWSRFADLYSAECSEQILGAGVPKARGVSGYKPLSNMSPRGSFNYRFESRLAPVLDCHLCILLCHISYMTRSHVLGPLDSKSPNDGTRLLEAKEPSRFASLR